jgi:chromosome segregation ATPase
MAAASPRAGTGARARLEAERDAAYAERDEALAQLAAIKQDLAEASANVEAWLEELQEARVRADEAESLLEAERSLSTPVRAAAA